MSIKGIFTKRWFQTFLLLTLIVLLVGGSFSKARWRQEIRNINFDYYNILAPRESSDDIVVIDIDDVSLAKPELGQWPWPRTILADLVTKLDAMGARVITFDMVFPEADRSSPDIAIKFFPADEAGNKLKEEISSLPSHDQVFADSIKAAKNVVTGFSYTGVEKEKILLPRIRAVYRGKKGTHPDKYIQSPKGSTNTLPVLESAAAGNGSFYTSSDSDGVIRRVPLILASTGSDGTSVIFPALSLETIRVILGEGGATVGMASDLTAKFDPDRYGVSEILFPKSKVSVPVNAKGEFLVYFAKSQPEKWYLSAHKILDGAVDKALIKDKIVLIGTSAVGLKDIRSTPLDAFRPGVDLHINIIDQILQQKFLKRPDWAAGYEAAVIFIAGIMIVFFAQWLSALFQAFFLVALILLGNYTGFHLYVKEGLQIEVAYPSICLIITFIAASLLAYIRTEADRRRVKNAFGHYISPDFMEELTKNPDKLALGGETRDLTIMFTDIRNFTGISERLSPAALTQLMNDFLTPMSDLVMQNRGTIDKFMGDAMMAFWNAPLDDPNHARHACLTALRMNEALRPINEKLKSEAAATGQEPVLLQAGIGLNTGTASVGNMGSRQRFAYSALGDNVNLASRLEGQTKSYGVEILIGPATEKLVPDLATLELDLLRVKGKNEPVHVFTLIGDEKVARSEEFKLWKAAQEQMLSQYRTMDFEAAENTLAECRVLSNGRLSAYYDMYQERINTLKTNRPNTDWDGVFVAMTK